MVSSLSTRETCMSMHKYLISRNSGLKKKAWKEDVQQKGEREGSQQVKFMVGIADKNAVVLCEPITEHMIREYFSEMIKERFSESWEKTAITTF